VLSRSGCTKYIWKYIKRNESVPFLLFLVLRKADFFSPPFFALPSHFRSLQLPSKKTEIRCDELLQGIIPQKQVNSFTMAKFIGCVSSLFLLLPYKSALMTLPPSELTSLSTARRSTVILSRTTLTTSRPVNPLHQPPFLDSSPLLPGPYVVPACFPIVLFPLRLLRL
jgi:hypothetical protein